MAKQLTKQKRIKKASNLLWAEGFDDLDAFIGAHIIADMAEEMAEEIREERKKGDES